MLAIPRIRVARFPDNVTCAVTTSWDDNDRLNLEVLKILESYKIKGTFYIDPGNTTYQNGGLSNRELRTLASKHEVGSHTWSHVDVTKCSKEFLLREYAKPKEYLEDATRKPIVALAYPYGAYSQQAWKIARDCGYLFARTTDEGQTEFPPRNSYLWGVSTYAIGKIQLWPTLVSKRTVLTDVGQLYLTNLTIDWRRLAQRLFQRAMITRGVWHLFGHAQEVLRPKLRKELLEVLDLVARRKDVWYATNQMLFLNEMVKERTHIRQRHGAHESVFDIRVGPSAGCWTKTTPVPLVIDLPEKWSSYEVDIRTTKRGRAEVTELERRILISIFDSGAQIALRRN